MMLVVVFIGNQILTDRKILECKELLRPDEVSDILKVSKRTVYQMVADGELEGVKVKECLRIRSRSVVALLEETQ